MNFYNNILYYFYKIDETTNIIIACLFMKTIKIKRKSVIIIFTIIYRYIILIICIHTYKNIQFIILLIFEQI